MSHHPPYLSIYDKSDTLMCITYLCLYIERVYTDVYSRDMYTLPLYIYTR